MILGQNNKFVFFTDLFSIAGLSVDVSLRAGWTALMYAASSGHAHIVEFLLDRDADANFSKATCM